MGREGVKMTFLSLLHMGRRVVRSECMSGKMDTREERGSAIFLTEAGSRLLNVKHSGQRLGKMAPMGC